LINNGKDKRQIPEEIRKGEGSAPSEKRDTV
jgi:hypothetical protein